MYDTVYLLSIVYDIWFKRKAIYLRKITLVIFWVEFVERLWTKIIYYRYYVANYI